ncbi:MAG: MBOAT family O-acyltransferase [Chitinophagales bacterium]|nr:MBOAT family protein [Bacteroidota bacterium]MCB9042777.1 MBOAT family protein [Chitinophagales bacterium]
MSLVYVEYLCFLVVFTGLYYLTSSKKIRAYLLLLCSFIFIAQHSFFSLIFLVASSVFTFFIAKKIAQTKSKPLLWFAISLHIIVLLGIKYFHWGNTLVNLSPLHFQTNTIIVALGVSFYTLQHISFLVETFHKRIPFPSLGNYLSYHAFFPKISSGPIEKPQTFLPQLASLNQSFSSENFVYGFQRILWGFFKKMVLADRLLPIVEQIFGLHTPAHGFTVWLGICLFTLALYFDFSAYIDIAIGSARILGIKLSENFNFPLHTTSIAAFWRCWHITLIQWLTQYLYYPIVYRFRKYPTLAVMLAIAVVFGLSGVWHGWGITYLLWAACHIVYLWFETLTKKQRNTIAKKLPRLFYQNFSIFITFNLVCFAHLFFRANSFATAQTLIQKVFTFPFFPQSVLVDFIAPLAGGGSQEQVFNLYISLLGCFLFLFLEKKIYPYYLSTKFRFSINFILLLLIFLFGIFDAGEAFIYLQF